MGYRINPEGCTWFKVIIVVFMGLSFSNVLWLSSGWISNDRVWGLRRYTRLFKLGYQGDHAVFEQTDSLRLCRVFHIRALKGHMRNVPAECPELMWLSGHSTVPRVQWESLSYPMKAFHNCVLWELTERRSTFDSSLHTTRAIVTREYTLSPLHYP